MAERERERGPLSTRSTQLQTSLSRDPGHHEEKRSRALALRIQPCTEKRRNGGTEGSCSLPRRCERQLLLPGTYITRVMQKPTTPSSSLPRQASAQPAPALCAPGLLASLGQVCWVARSLPRKESCLCSPVLTSLPAHWRGRESWGKSQMGPDLPHPAAGTAGAAEPSNWPRQAQELEERAAWKREGWESRGAAGET